MGEGRGKTKMIKLYLEALQLEEQEFRILKKRMLESSNELERRFILYVERKRR